MAQTELAHIEVDLALDGHRLRDCFSWSAAAGTDSAARQQLCEAASAFAARLVSEEGLPASFHDAIVQAIEEQASSSAGSASPDEEEQLETIECAGAPAVAVHQRSPTSACCVTPCALRRLDVQVGSTRLVDKFVWDCASTGSDTLAFARGLVSDLGLSPAFIPGVALSIRQQARLVQPVQPGSSVYLRGSETYFQHSSPCCLGQARVLRERKKQSGLTGASEASAALEQHGNSGSSGHLAAVQCLAYGVPLRSILDSAAARRCRLVLALA